MSNGSGLPGSTGNSVPVSLDTLSVDVITIQMDVCDVDDMLTCTGCDIAGRTPGAYACYATEQADGCCRVVLCMIVSFGCVIEAGTGPVYTINYDVSPGAPAGACRQLDPRNIAVAALQIPSLAVDAIPGNFCFSAGAPGILCCLCQ